jgi:hypothetical protein
MYRDELTSAAERIEGLRLRIESQDQELAGLREQVVKRLGSSPPAPRRWRRRAVAAVAGTLVAGGAAAAWFAQRPPPARDMALAHLTAAASSIREVTRRARRATLVAGPRWAESQERVAQLAARCERKVRRDTFDALPPGTRLMDFMVCQGCDCCLAGGVYPRRVFDRATSGSASECQLCSVEATLDSAGVTVTGGSPDNPLDGSPGLIFSLREPARLFGVTMRGTVFRRTGQVEPDREVSLVAYDPNGRPIDAAFASYPSWAPTSERIDDRRRARVLVVEACEGETIGRVDFGTRDYASVVTAVAVLPAAAR